MIGRFTRSEMMKYATLVVIIAYIIVLMIYTSGSTRPFDTVAGAVAKSLNMENLKEVDAQKFKRYYGLNASDYDGVVMYASEFSISAEEILIIKVKSPQQVAEVSEAIEKRLAGRRKDFDGYAPKEAQMIDQAQLVIRGTYIFLAVSPEAEKYKEVFTDSL